MDAFDKGIFVPHGHVLRAPDNHGPLSGLAVAVKDVFDWAGVPTGAGNPVWLASHAVPSRDAKAVAAVWAAGAELHGKTITDELAYSIHGDNVHYGTPPNAGAPGRVPGGSSSGSAAAVAAGVVDAALGTDTGGSVRVPAAYCGLYGLRTTHGVVDRTGVVPLSQTFDTVGWLAKSAGTLAQITDALLPQLPKTRPGRVYTLPEAEAVTDESTRQAVAEVLGRLGLEVLPLTNLTFEFGGLEGLRKTYVILQGWEAWLNHGSWIREHRPVFSTAITRRFEAASQVTKEEADNARRRMLAFREQLRAALGDGVLVLPATAGPAPLIDESEAAVEDLRARTMRLTSPAGLAGLPQVTVPVVGPDGLPRGVGLIGPAGADRTIVGMAALR